MSSIKDDSKFSARFTHERNQSGEFSPIKLKEFSLSITSPSGLFHNQDQHEVQSVKNPHRQDYRMSNSSFGSSILDNQQKRSIFFHQNNDELGLVEQFDEKSVVFQEKEFCQLCMIDFTSFNRRHHCRRCGKSVCQKCSMNKRPLSKNDKKTLYRICDYCDTKLSNFKLEQNQRDIIQAQIDKIELLNDRLENLDEHKTKLKQEIAQKKQQVKQFLDNSIQKKEELEQQVLFLRKELERLNSTRNTLYQSISHDEKIINERDEERNKLIMQKSIKLTDLAEKEQDLHIRETKNKELKEILEAIQKRLLQKSQLEEEEQKNEQNKAAMDEEQQRLDRMRNEKMKFMLDAIASHRIDEAMSEGSSFVSLDYRGRSDKRQPDPKNSSASLLEKVNEEESENSQLRESLQGNLMSKSLLKQINEQENQSISMKSIDQQSEECQKTPIIQRKEVQNNDKQQPVTTSKIQADNKKVKKSNKKKDKDKKIVNK